MRSRISKASRLLLALALYAGVAVAAAPLPQYDGQARNGVGTCAQSRCHDAERPWQTSKILQNEYRTWVEYSTHAESYKVLGSPEGRRIGELLRIDPLKSTLCLDCHTDHVPEALRGGNFRIEDGVGCEACHGGSKPWLENHVSMSGSRDDYLQAGLYPTEFPTPRAELCLGCHLGTAEKFVDHRLLAAGHPRLVFEQDTFFFNMPLHHVDDADYRYRKAPPPNAEFWLQGQLVAARRWLELLDDQRHMAGILPEPAFLDCYGCHEMYRHGRGSPQRRSPLRLNLAGLRMLEVIWADEGLETAIAAIDRATGEDRQRLQMAVRALRQQIDELAARNQQFEMADYRRMYIDLLDRAGAARFVRWLEAEQATMAIAALGRTLDPDGALAAPMDTLFNAVGDDQKYDVADFAAAARSLKAAYVQPR